MKKKKKYLTEYEKKGKKYAAIIKAKSMKGAEKLLEERKATERIIGVIG